MGLQVYWGGPPLHVSHVSRMRGCLGHILLAMGEAQEGKPNHVSTFQAFAQITSAVTSLVKAGCTAKPQINGRDLFSAIRVCLGEGEWRLKNKHLFNRNPNDWMPSDPNVPLTQSVGGDT